MHLRNRVTNFLYGLLGGICGVLIISAAGSVIASADEVHEVLNVKRLNIVEDSGKPAIVLANSKKLPGSNVNSDKPGVRRGVPGIIFYNNFGDEIGGLIFPARELEGAGYDGGVQLSMDQIKQTGQAIALRHWRTGDYVRSNLEITDYSTEKFAGDMHSDPDVQAVMKKMRAAESEEEQGEIYFNELLPLLGEKGYLAHRVFLGSEGAGSRRAMLELKDSRSRPRIRLIVDEEDNPRIELLNESGEVVKSIATNPE